MGILSKKAIKSAVESGEIVISPYDEKQLNTNSYDLRLGKQIKVYDCWTDSFKDPDGHPLISPKSTLWCGTLNTKIPQSVSTYEIPKEGFVLKPGVFYLMHTEERACSHSFVPVLDGKSSIARVGVKVHFTAGYGDLGFDGQYTLEVEAAGPVRIYAGMRICQIRFHSVVGEREDYKASGHYVGSNASGAIASKVHDQLKEDEDGRQKT